MQRPSTIRTLLALVLALVLAVGIPALAGCSPSDAGPDDAADASGTEDAGDADADDGDGDADPEGDADADADDGDADADTADEPADEPLSSFFVYFSYGGDRALAVTREVEYPVPDHESAMVELLAGVLPHEAATWPLLATAIPEGTQLLGIEVVDGVAFVDLSEEFDDGGGTWSVTARVAQVVYTLTQFDDIDAVRFKMEGVLVDIFSGEGLMLDSPQTADDYYDLVPVDA